MRPRLGASDAPKTNELFEHFSALEASGEITEFELRKLEREAKKLIRADAPAAHALLGAVHSYRGNAGNVKDHFKTVIRLTGEQYHAVHFYALALVRLGDLEEAFHLLNKGDWFLGKPDHVVFEDVISMGSVSGHFREALSRYRQLEEVLPETPLVKKGAGVLHEIRKKVENREFSEESVRKVIRLAHEIRVEKGRHLAMTQPMALMFDAETNSISYVLNVFVTAATAAEMNSELANRVVSQNDLMADPGMRFVVLFVGVS